MHRCWTCCFLTVILLCALASSALAAPPLNDNFLSPGQMMRPDGRVARAYISHGIVDTSEATTQPDLFNPSAQGAPLGGAGPEPATCGPTTVGKTVWFRFAPETSGGAEIIAGGFDTVVAVYRLDPATTQIAGVVRCQNDTPVGERVLLPALDRGAYAVQVGGAATAAGVAGGPLDFEFRFFADSDRDGVLDERPDRCPDQPGILAAGGCPPTMSVAPRLAWSGSPGGARLTRLTVDRVPSGARIEARCARCGLRQSVTATHGPRAVRLTRFVGRMLPNGATLEIRVTHASTGTGRYRFGAIGGVYRYRVAGGSLGPPTTRCLEPGSLKPRRTCT